MVMQKCKNCNQREFLIKEVMNSVLWDISTISCTVFVNNKLLWATILPVSTLNLTILTKVNQL
jgi:hypothetical protein